MTYKASKWVKTEPFTLPFSGVEVQLKRVPPQDLVLAGINLQATATAGRKAEREGWEALSGEEMRMLQAAADTICRLALAYPRVVATPEAVTDPDAQVYIGDIDGDDRMAVVGWVSDRIRSDLERAEAAAAPVAPVAPATPEETAALERALADQAALENGLGARPVAAGAARTRPRSAKGGAA